ncbi:hypothetical protein KSP40_PGU016111 [Platanthera guangdongensis]|uniref:Uncharacterized protein n=1 Tax=Platanthera guangdongensis TaxID=2320717 RepID=A0ABR2LGY9_9ASPA
MFKDSPEDFLRPLKISFPCKGSIWFVILPLCLGQTPPESGTGVTPVCHPGINIRGSTLESTKAAFIKSTEHTLQSALCHGVIVMRHVVEARVRTPDLLDNSLSIDR